MKKIIFGGPILTMDSEISPEAVVFDANRILFVGSKEEAKILHSDAYEIDLNGNTLLPGFIDTHCHLSFAGEIITQPSIFEATSIKEIIKEIEKQSDLAESEEIIFINGYEGYPIEDNRLITLNEMDKAAPSNPLFIRTAGTHATLVNSRALKLVLEQAMKQGIKVSQEDINSGFLRNEANLLALSMAPNLMSSRQKESSKQVMIDECIANGITSVYSLEGRSLYDDSDISELIKIKDSFPFHMKIYSQTTDVKSVINKDLKQIGGCFNCILDGDIDPGTAAFIDPYVNNPNNFGNLYFNLNDLKDFFLEAHLANLQICMHAIGDRAIKQAIDAYEYVLKKYPKKDHRHRIEHFEVSSFELIERAKSLDLVLGMQPVFDYYWPFENYVPYIGEKRAAMKCALRPILDSGIIVGGGSDSPVTSMNPMLGIHGAVNHSVETSRITVFEALKMYTINAAFIGFGENSRGSITEGKEANFVILSNNPLIVQTQDLDKIQILETIYQGKTVWTKSEEE